MCHGGGTLRIHVSFWKYRQLTPCLGVLLRGYGEFMSAATQVAPALSEKILGSSRKEIPQTW